MNKSVLIVEDVKRMRNLLIEYFVSDGYEVFAAADGIEALQKFDEHEVDLVILDIMMPKLNGFSVCRKIRMKSNVLIIMLTAKETETDRLQGFELGADDYVTKPFSPKVLIARANTLLNRFKDYESQKTDDDSITYGPIRINLTGREIMHFDKALETTNKEFDLLVYLIKSKGVVLTRDQIINQIWGDEYYGDGRVVDTNIKTLRKKLVDQGKWIKTVKGIGYKFEGCANEV